MPPRGRGRRGGGQTSKGASGPSARPRTLDELYSAIYGDRWPVLRTALCRPSDRVLLHNRYCQLPFAEALPANGAVTRVDADALSEAYVTAAAGDGEVAVATDSAQAQPDVAPADSAATAWVRQPPPRDDFGIAGFNRVEYGTVLAVDLLRIGPFDRALELCATPSGEAALMMLQFLGPDGELVVNEPQGDRAARLRRVLLDSVPVNYVPWRVTQRHGETWHEDCAYDRVLVSPPCSSERALLARSHGRPVEASVWSEQTSQERYAGKQRELLQRALATCKSGGRVVYTTNSLSPYENDAVVEECVRRSHCAVSVVADEDDGGVSSVGLTPFARGLCERTRLGWALLPDTARGYGPTYVCVLHKKSHRRSAESSACSSGSDSDDESG